MRTSVAEVHVRVVRLEAPEARLARFDYLLRPLVAGDEYLFSTFYELRRKLHTLVATKTESKG